ncbi:hypothetical protein MNV49_003655 [Pseudohyphozyma bogoriensis]|nr:hypothetical protein MNV49_003655 [Pseudohyphozyma bogoriensis]
MPSEAATALASFSLSPSDGPKTAVIVGGTLGVGAGVARLLAKKGVGRIISSGRNEVNGKKMVERIRDGAKEVGRQAEVEFVRCDLAEIKGMRAAVEAIASAVGPAGIDYLVMTQGGTPSGNKPKLTADGYDQAFAVQCLSRIAVSYLLTKKGTLASNATVMMICNTGQSFDAFSVDDIDLAGPRQAGQGNLMHFLDQSKRDSTVLDAFNEEMNKRFPQYNYLHVWPGIVKSEEFSVAGVPFPVNVVFWILIHTIAATPDSFAPVPVYLLLHPEAAKKSETEKYWAYTGKPSKIGAWAANEENREALFAKLLDVIEEKIDTLALSLGAPSIISDRWGVSDTGGVLTVGALPSHREFVPVALNQAQPLLRYKHRRQHRDSTPDPPTHLHLLRRGSARLAVSWLPAAGVRTVQGVSTRGPPAHVRARWVAANLGCTCAPWEVLSRCAPAEDVKGRNEGSSLGGSI